QTFYGREALQNVCKYLMLRLLLPTPMLYLPFSIFKQIRVSFEEVRWYMNDFCEERTKSLSLLADPGGAADTTTNTPRRKLGKAFTADDQAAEEEKQRMETQRGDLLTKLLANNTVLTSDEIFGDIFIFLVAG